MPAAKILIVAMFIAQLTACGGGSGNSSGSSSSPPPPVVNQSVGGIWRYQGTASNGDSVKSVGLVSEDGRSVLFSQNLTNGCAEVGIGSLTTIGSTVSGHAQVAVVNFAFSPSVNTNCAFSDGSTSATEVITGSVVPRSGLTLSGTVTTAGGTVLPSQPAVTANFDSMYTTGSILGTLAGNWTGPTGVVMSINSNGVLFAQDPASGCVVNGQVAIINSSYDAYSVTATYSNCTGPAAVLNGVTASGLMAVDLSVSPAVLYVGYSAVVGSSTIIVAATATN
jgi:hypothetical protein